MARHSSLLDILILLPWWVNACLGAMAYGVAKYLVPELTVENPILQGIVRAGPSIALPIAFVFGVLTLLSAFHAWRRGTLLESQTSISSIKSMSWKEFEYLTSEAFRRKGFTVQENLGAGADGGIDLALSRGGKRYLVQCKNWKTRSVGVSPVRELYALVMAEAADGGILVCSGNFSTEARRFAEGKPLQLIDGPELVRLVAGVQTAGNISSAADAPTCPRCQSVMVLRTAKRGKGIGQKFWGCSKFPKCRGTQAFGI